MALVIGTNPLAPEGFETEVLTQAVVGESGIVFADTDDEGVRWAWGPDNGWGPKPAPREQVSDKTYDHGQVDFTRFHDARTMAIPGWVMAPDHAALHRAEQRLRDAISIEPFMFRVIEPGFDSFAMVRQKGEVLWSEVNPRVATWSISLYARDPLIYSMRERTFDLAFPSVVGGRTWPATWPAVYPAVVVEGSEVVLNPGNLRVPLQLRVTGPAREGLDRLPRARAGAEPQQPRRHRLAACRGVPRHRHEEPAGLFMGDASRRKWATGVWLQVPPNSETTLQIAGTGTTSASRVAGSFRAARL
jgi:hypothetical protein